MTNDLAHARARSKSLIAVFIDGTMNDATPLQTESRTNVRRMFEELRSHADVVRLYVPGVGCEAVAEMDSDSAGEAGIVNAVEILLRTEKLQTTSLFGGLLGKFFGAGLTASVLAAYAFICAAREQHKHARLCIVGFSRGAYACCVLAHFMKHAGLVVAKEGFGLHLDTIRNAWTYDDKKLAAMIGSGESIAWQLPTNADEIQVDFLGCWDTVCAMGAPEHGLNWDVGGPSVGRVIDHLCGLIHRKVKSWNPRFIQLFVPPNVVKARHAVALHEYRVSFEALLWTPPEGRNPALRKVDIVQMWFPGAHADVGGGYLEAEALNVLSGHSLLWMKNEMWPDQRSGSDSSPKFWPIHDSSSGEFKKMGPKIRQSLTRSTAQQIRTIRISEWLQYGLRQGLEVRLCGDGRLPGTPASPAAFRPDIAALHAEVHDLALKVWLLGELTRAATGRSKGLIPKDYANPSAIEARDALSTSKSGFMREFSAEGLAAMVTNFARSDEMARLCCYHLALTGKATILISAACNAMKQTKGKGAAASEAALRVLYKVLLAPMGFVLEPHFQVRACCELEVEHFLPDVATRAVEVVRL